MKSFKLFLVVGMLTVAVLSCKSNKENEKPANTPLKIEKEKTLRVSVIKVNSPKAGELFTVGDAINIDIELKDVDVEVDSLVIDSYGNKTNIDAKNISYNWQTKDLKVGQNKLRIMAYSGAQKVDSYSLSLRFKSDVVPEQYKCKIIKTFNHDKGAYTQGLVYADGILYEGTGDWENSSVRKVKLETGEVMFKASIDSKYFGEGIVVYNDKIVQLTWRSNTGFVYDKENFKVLSRFEYATQGWGITTDGEKLIMSDGSSNIHFLDPEYYGEMGKIEVYDNNGPIDSLNELEYIDGLIYANVYQQTFIVAIDPNTGKIVKTIDCENLVPQGYAGDINNVLNGIAYDSENKRIFLTGKHWPVLYQVEFVKN